MRLTTFLAPTSMPTWRYASFTTALPGNAPINTALGANRMSALPAPERLSHGKVHVRDCESCDTEVSILDHIDRAITLEGPGSALVISFITSFVRAIIA